MKIRKSQYALSFVLAMLSAQAAAQTSEEQVVMRRPIPFTQGSAITPDPELPDSGPDGEPNPVSGAEATYYAYAKCGGSTMRVTCNEAVIDWDMGTISYRENVTRSACATQENNDWVRYVSYESTMPAGAFPITPDKVDEMHGASCGDYNIVNKDFYTVWCSQYGNSCERHQMQEFNGELRYLGNTEAEDSMCIQSDAHSQQAGYQEYIDSDGYYPATPLGLGICSEYENPTTEGFFVEGGYCDGETYNWDCYHITNFNEDDATYVLKPSAPQNCQNASQSTTSRQLIANYFAPDYKDPQDVDANICGDTGGGIGDGDDNGNGGIYGEYRVEFAPAPFETSMQERGGGRLSSRNPFESLGTEIRTEDYQSKYTYYCHRYDFSIFDAIAVDPAAASDSRYVARANFVDENQGVNCPAMAYAMLEQMVGTMNPTCASAAQPWVVIPNPSSPYPVAEHLCSPNYNTYVGEGNEGIAELNQPVMVVNETSGPTPQQCQNDALNCRWDVSWAVH